VNIDDLDPDFITVKQLIELLQKEPPDAVVVMRADGGTGYLEQVLPAQPDPIIDYPSVTLNDYWSKKDRP
jgi:hypothetical protein